MNYLLTSNNAISKFPYSLEELRTDNPLTSFPWEMSAEELSEWGVFAVEEQDPPAFSEQTESIELQPPALVNGVWLRGWIVVAASAEEIERRTIRLAVLIRHTRNNFLAKTDYTQLNDYQGTNAEILEIRNCRQLYRDIPAQTGFPWVIDWPAIPGED